MAFNHSEAENDIQFVSIIHEASGQSIVIPMICEDHRDIATLTINGVYYHLERVTQDELATDYKVDLDPEYSPKSDATGYCCLFAPYSN